MPPPMIDGNDMGGAVPTGVLPKENLEGTRAGLGASESLLRSDAEGAEALFEICVAIVAVPESSMPAFPLTISA